MKVPYSDMSGVRLHYEILHEEEKENFKALMDVARYTLFACVVGDKT
ncbi:Hypothetical protein W5S_3424 [Pectobacterium parmentieri]|uniref:Uncharacterized protein n=1 Tax=Pectobacterium parmentieri TaxID=1905730 RepID=A0A0H3IBY3_PECPM|nr:Hypothetical protein W5S_3424 [Pectobacterium parmentieri]